jgi:hypothetical protein
MKVKNKGTWMLSLFAVIVIAYSALQLSTTRALANNGGGGEAGACCTTSADCPGTDLCYTPSGGLADCSTQQKNYCRK